MTQHTERADGQMEPVRTTGDGAPMSALELTGGTSPGHAERLVNVLFGRSAAPQPEET